jgi:ABC-type polysaccharide/polyol phosphate transport system ATPase subunit
MKNNTAIRIQGLSKVYFRNTQKAHSVKDVVRHWFNFSHSKKLEKQPFWALKNINLEIPQGEIIGLVGNNGAGKSTLLKVIAQITPPTEGVVEVFGRFASMLEVGTGFHNDLSGRDNVYINGALLGMKRPDIVKHFDEIVDFAGLDSFIDTPLKFYSSGMQVRLAFAVAAFLQPEILLIDEVLAVGDFGFQQKCLAKMEERAKQGITILFVSHQLEAVRRLCTQCVYLEKGQIQQIGNTNTILDTYLKVQTQNQVSLHIVREEKDKKIYFSDIQLIDGRDEYLFSEDIKIKICIKIAPAFNRRVDIGYYILDDNSTNVFHSFRSFDLSNVKSDFTQKNTDLSRYNREGGSDLEKIIIIPKNLLPPHKYYFQFAIFDAVSAEVLDKPHQVLPITVKANFQLPDNQSEGIFIDSEWV